MNELTIGDKTYISSKRAAEITGYAKDYVGQLCREGHVEAKMVGRSWYVLESSIKNHRFGEPETKTVVPATDTAIGAPENQIISTWEPPKYVSEPLPSMLRLTPINRLETPAEPHIEAPETSETISDMQDAWKEWFETRSEPLLESPEIIDAREAEHEEELREEFATEEGVPINVHRLERPEIRPAFNEGERIAIRRTPPVIPPMPVHRPKARVEQQSIVRYERASTNIVAMALLVVAGFLVIAIAVVGSGFADAYVDQNSVLKFLGGTSTLYK